MRVPVNEPLLIGNEKKYLCECIDSGWISSDGPFVELFQEQLSNFVGRNFGVAVSSGTAALDIAIEALDFKPGDEIILPTFTIISCIQQILRKGLVPVFADADELTWNMSEKGLEEKITPRTKAIMAVHIYGLSPNINEINEICKKHKLYLIEDFAEAIGQTFNGQQCGSFGTISIASFYPNKHISTGEGGMLLMNDKSVYQNCMSLRNLAFEGPRRFIHKKLGWNYRMTNLQAAIGVAQLENITKFISKKRWIGKQYNERLNFFSNLLQKPILKTDFSDNIYWVYGVVSQNSARNASFYISKLAQFEIGTRPFFYPLHRQPVLKNYFTDTDFGQFPIADRLALNGFYLPSGLALTEEQIDYVCNKMNSLI
jgi:perosamine synthetase